MRLGVEAALVGRELVPGDVEIVDGQIGRVGLSSANGKGVASPGFVDLQVNGFGGIDFLDADAAGYRVAGRGDARDGRHGVPADIHHGSRGAARRGADGGAERL